MVRPDLTTITGEEEIPKKLPSGDYKLVLHCQELFWPFKDIIAWLTVEFKKLEGVIVKEVKVYEVKAPESPSKENVFWSDQPIYVIEVDHFDIEVNFTVESPLDLEMIFLIILALATLGVVLIYLLQVLYKMPPPIVPITTLGLIALILFILMAIKKKRR